jgi:hypothetical protein
MLYPLELRALKIRGALVPNLYLVSGHGVNERLRTDPTSGLNDILLQRRWRIDGGQNFSDGSTGFLRCTCHLWT